MDDASADWQPPTETEEKIMQARRDRADKISKIMGDYLLKGWKMLSSYCDNCGTILLKDRHGKIYCIACSELNSDTDKDNPVLNEEAAQSQAREHQRIHADRRIATAKIATDNGGLCCNGDSDSSGDFPVPPEKGSFSAPVTRSETALASKDGSAFSVKASSAPMSQVVTGRSRIARSFVANVDDTQEVLIEKLKWATDQIRSTTSVELCTQLCKLIQAVAEALHAVQRLNMG